MFYRALIIIMSLTESNPYRFRQSKLVAKSKLSRGLGGSWDKAEEEDPLLICFAILA